MNYDYFIYLLKNTYSGQRRREKIKEAMPSRNS